MSHLHLFIPTERDSGTAGVSPQPVWKPWRTQKISTPVGNRREILPPSTRHYTACCMTDPEVCNSQQEPTTRWSGMRVPPGTAAAIWSIAIALSYRWMNTDHRWETDRIKPNYKRTPLARIVLDLRVNLSVL